MIWWCSRVRAREILSVCFLINFDASAKATDSTFLSSMRWTFSLMFIYLLSKYSNFFWSFSTTLSSRTEPMLVGMIDLKLPTDTLSYENLLSLGMIEGLTSILVWLHSFILITDARGINSSLLTWFLGVFFAELPTAWDELAYSDKSMDWISITFVLPAWSALFKETASLVNSDAEPSVRLITDSGALWGTILLLSPVSVVWNGDYSGVIRFLMTFFSLACVLLVFTLPPMWTLLFWDDSPELSSLIAFKSCTTLFIDIVIQGPFLLFRVGLSLFFTGEGRGPI